MAVLQRLCYDGDAAGMPANRASGNVKIAHCSKIARHAYHSAVPHIVPNDHLAPKFRSTLQQRQCDRICVITACAVVCPAVFHFVGNPWHSKAKFTPHSDVLDRSCIHEAGLASVHFAGSIYIEIVVPYEMQMQCSGLFVPDKPPSGQGLHVHKAVRRQSCTIASDCAQSSI